MSVEELTVTCKSCGEEFPTPIQMDREAFEETQLQDNMYECSHCKQINAYHQEDHRYQEPPIAAAQP